MKAKNGVVIATEKKLPTCLIDETSMQKVRRRLSRAPRPGSGAEAQTPRAGRCAPSRRAPHGSLGALTRAVLVPQVVKLTDNIAVVYSGMGPDFRVLCRKGRKSAQAYYRIYRETIPVGMLTRELAAVMQEFTQRGGVRPFGISLLVAGFDFNGPQLFQVKSAHGARHGTRPP